MMISYDGKGLEVTARLLSRIDADDLIVALHSMKRLLPIPDEVFERDVSRELRETGQWHIGGAAK